VAKVIDMFLEIAKWFDEPIAHCLSWKRHNLRIVIAGSAYVFMYICT
jgi:hypothetical protein